MAHEVFISHSSSDKPVADAVCAALERIRIRCWMAPRDVQPGRSFAGEITRAIQHSKVLVLIFSATASSIAPAPPQTPEFAPFLTRFATILRTAASKAGTIWQKNSRLLIIGAAAVLLIFCTLIVLGVASHWSKKSSAEKDYAEA